MGPEAAASGLIIRHYIVVSVNLGLGNAVMAVLLP